jgi:hypothetical protein
MEDLKDFNEPGHRVMSASAVYQKGIYHLFMLKNKEASDAYARILRVYQCLFQLCLTQLLLDRDYQLKPRDISPRLKEHCRDRENPTRKEIDPAAIVTHSVFEKGRWTGAKRGHPLHEISKTTIKLYRRVVEARHNLIYRPFMLAGYFWEDCTLLDLLSTVPEVEELERAYREFVQAMLKWNTVENEDSLKWIKSMNEKASGQGSAEHGTGDPLPKVMPRHAGYFLQMLFMVYEDRRDSRPTETLLSTYARMMNPDDEELLRAIREYRNRIINLGSVLSVIHVLGEWHAGEI